MRKAIFLAAEAWRRAYDRLGTGKHETPDAKLDFKLPSTGETVTLDGWHREVRQGENGDYTVYISPEGVPYDSIQYAMGTVESMTPDTVEKSNAIHVMRRLLSEFKEGHSFEALEMPMDSVSAAAFRGKDATGFALSQLDDYLHRGTHPVVKHMSLYVYSMWVYRSEKAPFAEDASSTRTRKLRHIEIPFDDSYAAARTWVQRITKEPRVPRPEGYRFMTTVDPEMHYLLKAVLLRPVYLPSNVQETETKQDVLLRAYRGLCTPPQDDKSWPAVSGGPDSPGPFERGWKNFWETQRPLATAAQQKTMLRDGNAESWTSPSLWNTQEMELELESARETHLDGEGAHAIRCTLIQNNAPSASDATSRNWPFCSIREDRELFNFNQFLFKVIRTDNSS